VSVEQLPTTERSSLRPLLEIHRPGDAMISHYVLEHPASKIRIWVHRVAPGRVDGFLIRAQTGQDLFRPLVSLRAPGSASAAGLLQAAFPSPAPAIFSMPESLGLWVLPLLSVETTTRVLLYRLNPNRLEPVINILVRRTDSPAGLPRYEIRNDERLLAAAGVNWQSSEWAEIFVQTDPGVRERGYGKSVCAALCRQLVEEKKDVLYALEEENLPSLRLAQGLGFEDTGEREIICNGSVLVAPPSIESNSVG
jgi:RimJ/RimL family protein N-acetyltransferase